MDSEIKKALRMRALGYEVEEITEESVLEKEGGEKVVKKRKTTKQVPPDITAIKMLIELEGEKGEALTLEEMEKEKIRLMKELKEIEKKKQKKGQASFFD